MIATLYPVLELAADLETPVTCFLKLKPLEPVFLLESVEQNESIGRFSFIGIQPLRKLVLTNPARCNLFFADLEACIRDLPKTSDLRLPSGLAGFFSYRMAELLHPKLKIKSSEDPLAFFVLPGAILTFDHLRHKLLFSSALPENESIRLANEIRNCLRGNLKLPKTGTSSRPVSNLSRTEFTDLVDKAKQSIASGEIYQIVLSAQFSGETQADPFQLYRSLRMINPSPYMFYFDFQGGFQFFGSSPETLVRTDGNRITLRPIAGTRSRGSSPAEDLILGKELMANDKERAEHLMLVDLARNDIGKLALPGTISVSEFMNIERYSHVMHLVSTVQSDFLRRPSLQELFSAVFPAGTVSGAPKLRAMQIIEQLEPHSRGLYAGSLGYISATGDIDHCISIRCVRTSQQRYEFCAGAGIVADSNPDHEYEEILSKSSALSQMLQLSKEPL